MTPEEIKLFTRKKFRRQILAKTGGLCAYCGEPLVEGKRWAIEHVIPERLGGTSDIGNLLPACKTCNTRKATRTPQQWKEYINTKMQSVLYETVEFYESYSFAFDFDKWQDVYNQLASASTSIQSMCSDMKFYYEKEGAIDGS